MENGSIVKKCLLGLAEDASAVPSTYIGHLTAACNSSSVGIKCLWSPKATLKNPHPHPFRKLINKFYKMRTG